MRYLINDYVHNHKNKDSGGEEAWDGVLQGEGEVDVGVDHGQEESRSAIYRLGRDLVGYTVEEHAGGFLPLSCCLLQFRLQKNKKWLY